MTASVHQTEQLLFTVLLQLIVMIGAARILGGLFRRMGQPAAVGEIVAGLMLGPSLFGYLFPGASAALFGAKPDPAITILSQIGLVLLMFQIGCGFEFGRLQSPRLRPKRPRRRRPRGMWSRAQWWGRSIGQRRPAPSPSSRLAIR